MELGGYVFASVLPRAGGTYFFYTVTLILKSSVVWGDEDANPNNTCAGRFIVLSVCWASQHTQQVGRCANTMYLLKTITLVELKISSSVVMEYQPEFTNGCFSGRASEGIVWRVNEFSSCKSTFILMTFSVLMSK